MSSAVIGYFTRSTNLHFISNTQDSITVNVSCHLSAMPPIPGSVGCEVCEGDEKSNCYTFTNTNYELIITGQANFGGLNEDELPAVYTYSVYAVDGFSTRLDGCVYAQETYSSSAAASGTCVKLSAALYRCASNMPISQLNK